MLDSIGKSPCKRASSYPEIQEFLAFEITLQMVIHMDGTYTDGCSGIEHVARLQREETADIADELVHLIQHVGRIARLHRLSIDVQMEGQPVPESIPSFFKGGFFLSFHDGVTTRKSLHAFFLREVRAGFLTRNGSPLA
jgi:hypothetical protein